MLPLRDNVPSRHPALMTYALILVNVGVFVYELTRSPEELAVLFRCQGVIPVRFTDPVAARFQGCLGSSVLALFSYMFLHGGWLHLISNVWVLHLFGDNVEDRLGHIRFLLFYLLCGMLAVLAHVMLMPASTLPTIGASGAIAGVMGAYFIFYPRARIVVVVPILFYPLLAEVPAFLYLLVWVVTQVLGGSMARLAGTSVSGGVAFWAHAGGFAAGVLAGVLWHPRKRRGRRVTT